MLKFVQIALALHYTHSKVGAALAACQHHAQQTLFSFWNVHSHMPGADAICRGRRTAACTAAVQAHALALCFSSAPAPALSGICGVKARACCLQGIIHRDLKANNIFCCSHGIVKLGDFGISKALGQQQNFARTMVGTPYYMSPEILKARGHTCQLRRPNPSMQGPRLVLLSVLAGVPIVCCQLCGPSAGLYPTPFDWDFGALAGMPTA